MTKTVLISLSSSFFTWALVELAMVAGWWWCWIIIGLYLAGAFIWMKRLSYLIKKSERQAHRG